MSTRAGQWPDVSGPYDGGYFDRDEQAWISDERAVEQDGALVTVQSSRGAYTGRIVRSLPRRGVVVVAVDGEDRRVLIPIPEPDTPRRITDAHEDFHDSWPIAPPGPGVWRRALDWMERAGELVAAPGSVFALSTEALEWPPERFTPHPDIDGLDRHDQRVEVAEAAFLRLVIDRDGPATAPGALTGLVWMDHPNDPGAGFSAAFIRRDDDPERFMIRLKGSAPLAAQEALLVLADALFPRDTA